MEKREAREMSERKREGEGALWAVFIVRLVSWQWRPTTRTTAITTTT